jgi:hypothetical protein
MEGEYVQMNTMTAQAANLMCAFLLGAGSALPAAGGEGGGAVLNGLHYNTLGPSSRFLVGFTGSLRYTAVAGGSRLVIGCSSTQVGSPPGAARLTFNDGGLQSAVVERVASDSAAIILTLRPGMTASVSLPAGSAALCIDVKKGKTAPVDVRALYEAEMRAGAEAAGPLPAPPRGPAPPVFAISLVIAAASTVLIMLVVYRAMRRRPISPALPAAPVSCDDGVEEEELRVPEAAESPDDEDAFYGVGRDLRSTRGEFALAMRLHSGSMGEGSRRSARGACSADATTAERVKVARRLGIGRGEIDLALRLRKLESITPVEEEIS